VQVKPCASRASSARSLRTVAVAVFPCTVFVHVYFVAAEADPAPSAIVAAALAPARVTAIHFRIETCRIGLVPARPAEVGTLH
jgi:hypothetical protein